jgi:TolA-binding protein
MRRAARPLVALALPARLAVCGAPLLFLPGPAQAVSSQAIPTDALFGRLSDIEARYRDIEGSLTRRPQALPEGEQAARRLTDAEVLYSLRNYDAAATILFDVVDRYPRTAVYPDALFYLGESLYQTRSYLAARRFLEKLVETQTQHPRYQEALLRLIEIGLHLNNYEQVDKWLDRLALIPKEKALAAGPYVRGKTYFLRADYDRALQALAGVSPQNPFSMQARYLTGACRVARGQLNEAVTDFSALVAQTPKSEDDRRLIELGHLALGRIYYEQGQNTKAQESYLLISQRSDLFPEALYESAWVAIKAKDYKRAQRQLELLVLAQPDALNVPEAKLLMGNLQIRTGEHQPATRWFQKTRDEFEPVRKQLDEVLAQNRDAPVYFRELIRKNLDKFDIALVVPKTAARYLKSDKEVARFAVVAGDVSELRRVLAESEETIVRLERALSGSAKYNVDPGLSQLRTGSIAASGELIGVRRQLIERMTEVVTSAASADEMRRLAELARRRGDLEKDLIRVLATLGSRSKAEVARFAANELDKRASELQVHLSTLGRQRDAIAKYYNETSRQQKISAEQFQKEIANLKEQEEEVRRKYDQLRKEIQETVSLAENDGQQLETSAKTRQDYQLALKEELELLDTLRKRLTGANRSSANQIWAALSRAGTLDLSLMDLLARINGMLEIKLAEVNAGLLLERENIKNYRQSLDGCSGETEDVGGGVLADVLRTTARRFYDLVVRADVGIIDVAWAVKQQHTDKVSRMVREQKREMKLLDDEFKEVLKE